MTVKLMSWHCARGNCGFCTDIDCACTECHFVCITCKKGCRVVYGAQCADCVRQNARRSSRQPTPCDKCGGGPAYRNPALRRNEILCSACHEMDGQHVALPSVVVDQLELSPCATDDINSPTHRWLRVKGQRYRCRNVGCQADRVFLKGV